MEHLKSDFAFELFNAQLDMETIDKVYKIFEQVIVKYDVTKKENSLVVYNDNSPILNRYYAVKRIEGLSEHTLYNYMKVIATMFDYLGKKVSDLVADDVRYFLAMYQRDRQVTLTTIAKYQEYIKNFLTWCNEEEYIKIDISKKLKPIKHEITEKQPMSPTELEQIRLACEHPREKAIIELLFATGCRVSELCGLKKSDINFANNTVRLFGKGNKERYTPISPKAMLSVKAYWKTRNDNCEYAIVSLRNPHKLTRSSINNIIDDITSRCEIQSDISPHTFRHTTATIALTNGMPIQHIQKILGHTNLTTTQRYAQVNMADVMNDYRKYIS